MVTLPAPAMTPAASSGVACALNQSCFCITLDTARLAEAMTLASGDDRFFAEQLEGRPHLFSPIAVFLSETDRAAMLATIRAIEAVAALPGYRTRVAVRHPGLTDGDLGPAGVFMGYDFHLADGAPPRLIEINTNAGGAFLNALSARAQAACCEAVEPLMRGSYIAGFDAAVIAMFEAEHRRQAREPGGRLNRIAIVDDQPQGQYLYPEFVLARSLLRTHGYDAVICDPSALTFEGGRLRHGGQPVDLVYNRLVDFTLQAPQHAALRAAWVQGAAVVTPNPFHHALLADKGNLVLLSDPDVLAACGASPGMIQALADLPRAEPVTPVNAERLWARRKSLFFKPVRGYGGKAVYRGDKLTRSAWNDIQASDYVAQDLAPPGERQVMIDGQMQARKMDVRLYTYGGEPLLAAARLYQGQTTNFRTPGGGFAPVYFV